MAVVVVAAVGVALVLLAELFGLGVYGLLTLVVPAALALLYLREYDRRPLERPPHPSPSPLSEAIEPPAPIPPGPLTLFDENSPIAENETPVPDPAGPQDGSGTR
ncbi:MAG: hypothetical protein WA761_09870 [Thermoplasmata archaeon]